MQSCFKRSTLADVRPDPVSIAGKSRSSSFVSTLGAQILVSGLSAFAISRGSVLRFDRIRIPVIDPSNPTAELFLDVDLRELAGNGD